MRPDAGTPIRPFVWIFQPHLFSRAKFFAHQFAKSLAKADDVIITGVLPRPVKKQADFPDISPSTIVDAAAGLQDASRRRGFSRLRICAWPPR